MPPKKKSTATKSTKSTATVDKKLTDSFKRVKKFNIDRLDKSTKADEEAKVSVREEIKVPILEEILKQFDLNADYGPMIGISRTDRLKRAKYFNLHLQDEVKDILHDNDLLRKHPELDLNIWHDIDHNTHVANNKY